MYLQTSRLQYNLQKVGVFQTAHSDKNIQAEACRYIILQKRTIYLPDSLWYILAERQSQKGAFSEWIFPNLLKPEWPLNPNRAYRQLKKLLESGGLPSIRFHDLRHTFTSHAANSGIAPKTLSEIVGHSKASFTLDHYAHVTSDMQKNAANIVTNYITDILGKELKPWQSAEKQAKER